ncbi:hypothetical protein GCM10022237_21100 [Nocardioides ginsengisoli]|uniref:DUF4352 domain-containing protein n=1 Tax=Nocardioides ginsengisoli TaxID=363868 RepID=A0ABW3W3G6_9ACTN
MTRSRIAYLSVSVVLVLLVATGVLWSVGFRRAADVVTSTGDTVCEGTRPTRVADDGFGAEYFRRVGIPMRRGFACILHIEVRNNGDRGVRIGQVRFPAGPSAGSAYEVTSIDSRRVPVDDESDGGDAVVDLDRQLDGGESYVVEVRVRFRESGCDGEGGAEQPWPSIAVNSLLASHEVVVSDVPSFLGTADSTCDE